MAKTYDFDAYLREAQPLPFVLNGPDGEISIDPPTADVMLRFEEAPTSRRRLQVLCGERWDEVYALLRDRPAGVLLKLTMDMIRHFNLGEVPEGGTPLSSIS